LRVPFSKVPVEVQMTKRTIAVAALFVLAIGGAAASQEKPKIVKRPPPPPDVADSQGMFREYCASCHGPEGKGDGPAAAALKTVPADLTKISARNGGKFPTAKVRRYIEGLDEIPAHGSRDMPVWGPVLRSLGGGQADVQLRVENLTKYLESIQQK
jgi:mono/diheme cytochrome c family protein